MNGRCRCGATRSDLATWPSAIQAAKEAPHPHLIVARVLQARVRDDAPTQSDLRRSRVRCRWLRWRYVLSIGREVRHPVHVADGCAQRTRTAAAPLERAAGLVPASPPARFWLVCEAAAPVLSSRPLSDGLASRVVLRCGSELKARAKSRLPSSALQVRRRLTIIFRLLLKNREDQTGAENGD